MGLDHNNNITESTGTSNLTTFVEGVIDDEIVDGQAAI